MSGRGCAPPAIGTRGRQCASGHQAGSAACSFYPKTGPGAIGEPVYLNTPQGKRQVGKVIGENGGRVLLKRVVEAKHLHRRFNAWGVDALLLDSLAKSGVSNIRVEAEDTGTVEVASVEIYRTRGIRQDFGHGPQVFLPRRFFRRVDRLQRRLPL